MKKIIILIICALIFIAACTEEEYIAQFNGTRPFPDVISEQEMVRALFKAYHGEGNGSVNEILQEYPEWEKAVVGDIVLVQDLWTNWKNEEPYYYYITLRLPGGQNIMKGIARAMVADELAGTVGNYNVWGDHILPEKELQKEQAVKMLCLKYNIPATVEHKVKAVLVPAHKMSQSEWGWAVWFAKPQQVTSAAGQTYQADTFWVSHRIYDVDWCEPNGMGTDWLEKEPLICTVAQDIFNIRDVHYTDMLQRKTRNDPYEDYPELTVVEYYLSEYMPDY